MVEPTANSDRKLELADHITPEFIGVWPPLDNLVPLTSELIDGVVVVRAWKWWPAVFAIFPVIITAVLLPFFLVAGWLVFLGAVVAALSVIAIMLLEFHLRWHGTLCAFTNDGHSAVSFPRHQKLVLFASVYKVDLVWVKATPNTYLRRVGLVIVKGVETDTQRTLSVPVFISYNKTQCQKALVTIQELLMKKLQPLA